MAPQNRSVLLIDDDPYRAEVGAAVFAEAGLRLVTTPDLLAARRVLAESRPVAVVVELGLFGWEAFVAFRQAAGSALPVVLMVGWADDAMVATARAAGADDLLIHPMPEDLLRAVLRVCRLSTRLGEG